MNPEKTILVVDDHEAIVLLVQTILYMEGYTVIHGCNGEDALYMSENHPLPIHLLLTDVRMGPNLNGCDVATAMRVMRPEIKVVYMSAFADDERVNSEVNAGQAAFVRKPFSPSDLIAKVGLCLHELPIKSGNPAS